MEEEPEIRKNVLVNLPGSVFIYQNLLFCFTLFLGLSTALRLIHLSPNLFGNQKIFLPTISFWQFLFYFLAATSFIFFIVALKKFQKVKTELLKIIFILAISTGTLLLFLVWLPYFPSLILVFVLIFWWLLRPSVLIHNLCLVFGIAGIGLVGLRLDSLVIIALLIIFSLYDFVAVNITKHMIKMAKEMAKAGAILAFIVPQRFFDFLTDLKEVKLGRNFLILGGGDVAFPLIFSVSFVPQQILDSLIVALFSLIGLFLGMFIFLRQKKPKPFPALPPIAFFSILGYLITLAL